MDEDSTITDLLKEINSSYLTIYKHGIVIKTDNTLIMEDVVLSIGNHLACIVERMVFHIPSIQNKIKEDKEKKEKFNQETH